MATIHHQVLISAPVAKVYETLSTPEAIGTWWDKQTPIQTDRGLVLEHNPGPEHGAVQLRVVEQVPNKRVEWECISIHPKSSPASAWTGTHFVFEIGAIRLIRCARPRWIFLKPAMMSGVNSSGSTTPLGRRFCKT